MSERSGKASLPCFTGDYAGGSGSSRRALFFYASGGQEDAVRAACTRHLHPHLPNAADTLGTGTGRRRLPATTTSASAAAAFDDLTVSGRDALLTEHGPEEWPNLFRVARFYSAVDSLQAQRARTQVMEAVAKMFSEVDVMVTPSSGAQLTATNLTGHPAIIVPNGVRGDDAPPPEHPEDGHPRNVGGPGTPVSLTFLGNLYADAQLAALARAYSGEDAPAMSA